MNKMPHIPLVVLILSLLLIPACQHRDQTSSTNTPQPRSGQASPTRTQLAIPTLAPPETYLPEAAVATVIITPTTTLRSTETTEAAIQSDFINGLCPGLNRPFGLYSLADPYIDHDTEPETIYALFQLEVLEKGGTGKTCTLYLAPGPLGDPQIAGNNIFWQSVDYDLETVTVWQYASFKDATDDTLPSHNPLLQTTRNTSLGKVGLADFIASIEGELLIWSYTDPLLNEDNQLAYVQTIYAISPDDPPDQRPAIEIWFDVVPETDGRSHIIRLRHISTDTDLLYFSDEPIGLGRHWPEPAGQYSTLYSISVSGEDAPKLLYDCGQDYWCISDFSEELDLLITVENNSNSIEVRRLSSGELINSIQAPEVYNLVRQALISPDGGIAFMGVALEGSIFDSPPGDVAIFYSEPPYNNDPTRVLSDVGLQNLRGWVTSEQILADGNAVDDARSEGIPIPAKLMLIDIDDRNSTELPRSAYEFRALVP